MRTAVGIIGAGPAGLLLARLLEREGIDSVVLERRSRAYVEARIRAGILEQTTVELLRRARVHERMERGAIPHDGVNLAFDGRSVRIDFKDLTGGKNVLTWGQTQITRDLIAARIASGGPLFFEAPALTVENIDGAAATVVFERHGHHQELVCDFVAGCDGSHGVARSQAPERAIRTYEKVYPFGWLGILADTPPVHEELIYANHARGFALCSMRSPTRSRYYVQCGLDDHVDNWSDEAFWDELRRRLPPDFAERLVSGPRLEMSIAPLRSFVAEPMRFGRLLLAGDAAHIMPPTGAKGLNMAASDVHYLSRALIAHYHDGRDDLLDRYSAVCLRRVWKAIRFSWWFTTIMHRFGDDPIGRRLQLAELDYLSDSVAAQTALAENYVGLPFEAFD